MAVLLVIGVVCVCLALALAVRRWRSTREPRWWPEFEREFRAYVDGSGNTAPPPAHRRRRP